MSRTTTWERLRFAGRPTAPSAGSNGGRRGGGVTSLGLSENEEEEAWHREILMALGSQDPAMQAEILAKAGLSGLIPVSDDDDPGGGGGEPKSLQVVSGRVSPGCELLCAFDDDGGEEAAEQRQQPPAGMTNAGRRPTDEEKEEEEEMMDDEEEMRILRAQRLQAAKQAFRECFNALRAHGFEPNAAAVAALRLCRGEGLDEDEDGVKLLVPLNAGNRCHRPSSALPQGGAHGAHRYTAYVGLDC